jgi:hypothetical protein
VGDLQSYKDHLMKAKEVVHWNEVSVTRVESTVTWRFNSLSCAGETLNEP